MRKELTDITVVMDRSGSMSTHKLDAEGGLKTFIEQQAGQPGDCLFTLVQFDTVYEFVHRAVNLKYIIPVCSLVPRGGTALLDAVGRAIVETGDRLKNISENDRPGLVVFVIITDGEENSSREFTKAKVKEMIEHQQSVYKWKFTYIGSNQDAFAEAGGIGISSALGYSGQNTSAAFSAGAGHVSRMRGMSMKGLEVADAYTDQEREAAK